MKPTLRISLSIVTLLGIVIISCSKNKEKDWMCVCTTELQQGGTAINKERLLMLTKDIAESRCKASGGANTECILEEVD